MFSQLANGYETARTEWRMWTDRAVAATLREWCRRELAPWQGRPVDTAALCAIERPWLFHVMLGPGGAVVAPRVRGTDDGGPRAQRRLGYYLPFLDRVARRAGLAAPVTIALDLNDEPLSSAGLPVFSFQKTAGSDNILLPDVEFLQPTHNALPSWLTYDRTPWARKRPTAVFAGSTTGGVITPEVVRTLALPRLRAGVFFGGAAEVDFRLPNLVECDSPETEAMLRAMGFGTGALSWQEQFGHRFIISMDGNGATCSRVVVTLRSRSVLLKYASDRLLYYFHGLVPGVHFVPIARDSDVLLSVAAARADAAPFRAMNEAARRFAGTFLTRRAVERYMAELLRGYAETVAAPPDDGRRSRA